MQHPPSSLTDRKLPAFFSRYELLEVLGKGGMGRVYRATLNGPAGFRKEVALKMVLDRDGTVLMRRRDQLAHEARLGGLLRHPNIVDTYELGEFQGEMFIAMEYIHGLPLSTLQFREKGLPPAAALDVLLQVAAGLDHAHSLCVDGKQTPLVHRDLKPSNILIDRTGLAKITDFGVSILQLQDQHRPQAISGTLRYMSPEQITGGKVGPRSDLFAFGLVSYELLIGARLFPRGNPQEVARSIIRAADLAEASAKLRQLDTVLPGIAELVVHCLKLRVSDRVPSARRIFERMRVLRAEAPGEPLLQVLSRHLSGSQLLHIPGLSIGPNNAGISQTAQRQSKDPSSAKTNLPDTLPVLYGRDTLLKELERQIKKKGRILTLKGPGGIGKSAAALHYLHSAEERFANGRWVFDFSATRDQGEILQKIAQEYSLPLKPEDTESNIQQIGQFLATQEDCILLFDSCDRVLSPLKELLSAWTELAPQAVFLVTSRTRLKLKGERLLELAPLEEAHSLSLFMEKASQLGRRSPINTSIAAQIVERLEGNPLAITLAAGRLRELEPQVLLERLTDRFSALSTSGDTSSRQATLRATIEWSWTLLKSSEADGLAQLSVFRGSFTADAAEAILDLSAHPEALRPTELLQRLIDHSLLQPLPRADQPRFRLSESIREFAFKQLDHQREALEDRFIRHFQRRGEPQFRRLLKRGGSEGREVIRDFSNITHALDLALERRSPAAMACFLAVVTILQRTGPITRCLDIAEKMSILPLTPHQKATIALQQSDALIVSGRLDKAATLAQQVHQDSDVLMDPELTSQALYLLSLIETQRGNFHFVINEAETGIKLAQQGLNNELVAWWLSLRGRAHRLLGSYQESIRDFETSASIARQLGDQTLLANSLGSQGIIENIQGNTRVAVRLVGQSVALAANSGDRRLQASRLYLLGTILLESGEVDSALEDYRQARIKYQELNERFNEAMVLVGISQVHYLNNHFVEARALLFETLQILKEHGAEAHSGIAYINLGEIETDMGLLDEAETHLYEGLKVSNQTGSHRVKAANQAALGRLFLKQGRLAEAKPLIDTALKAFQTNEDMTELGKVYCCLAEYNQLVGDQVSAEAALNEAQTIATKLKTAQKSELSRRIRRLSPSN